MKRILPLYEKSAVKANIWSTAFPPLYRIISMIGVLFILYFGSRNVLGTGWKSWDVAAFTTFLSCFLKLAVKSSHAAKLFNAVHKAQVSWKRIKPLMKEDTYEDDSLVQKPGMLEVSEVSFAYPGGEKIYEDFNLSAFPGQIIGVTGAVACGKSTLGKTFLCEYPYEGRIRFHGKELSEMTKAERTGMIGYLGHDPELFNDSVRNNILLGDDDDPEKYLKAVCFDGEVAEMEEGMDTIVGNGGVRLSGGQAQRLALARTLCHKRPILILDDPFSALDRETEEEVFANLRKFTADSIVILLSHRLYLFPEMDQVLWMEAGKVTAGTHEQILAKFPEYARLYEAQADALMHTVRRMEVRIMQKNKQMQKNKRQNVKNVRSVIRQTVTGYAGCHSDLLAVTGAIVTALLPPWILGSIVDTITVGNAVPVALVILYFAFTVLTGLTESLREGLLTVFGQKITHALRSSMMEKYTNLTAGELTKQEPGTIVSQFVGDVDTVENLFTSGIISMFADACKIISILVVIWLKNRGLAIVLLVLLPFLYWFTRTVQKNMLKPRSRIVAPWQSIRTCAGDAAQYPHHSYAGKRALHGATL